MNQLIQDLQNNNNLTEEEKSQIKEQVVIQSADVSTAYSSNARYFAWKSAWQDIKKNPIWGSGLKQYIYRYPSSVESIEIPPHNFILEYVLAFGIIGFLLWAVLILYPIACSFKQKITRTIKSPVAFMMLFSFLFACAGAFVQPYFISPAVMTIMFVLIGAYSLCIRETVSRQYNNLNGNDADE